MWGSRTRAAWFTLLFAFGCSSGSDKATAPPGEGDTDFVSDVSEQNGGRNGPAGFSGAGGAASAGSAKASGAESADASASRAIAEADIIQTDGDRLFALSRYSGLTVIDIANPRNLRVLGNHRSGATPFEMYLKDGVAYVMLNGFGSYTYDASLGYAQWLSTARMQALDVSDPANIRVIGDVPVPGEISDSRLVGGIVYLATYQDQYCYQCDGTDNTRVTAFDTSDPANFRKVDELRFESPVGGWGKRSISVTQERMYIAGPHWSDRITRGSLQVVDISDPTGHLVLGAEISVAGSIESRWQMDEHDGVLRVVSQAGGWRSATPPEVETFRIESAKKLTPLGRLEMVLPRPEDLQSVRFDGTRGYAVTFQRTDPLFTLDLSNPAVPRQVGELEIPGWLHHMEPRGNRLYALGFDDPAEGRGLTVSIFDVENLSRPAMLDRVIFGGEWASVAEDQDRVHKVFNLALDQGMILVPYSGSQSDQATCTYRWGSGIQLIDAVGDDLVLRGVAPHVGEARRSLLHGGMLFGIGDNAVQSFDIQNRDTPTRLDSVEVARNISSVQLMGDHVLRFGNDWNTQRTLLDFAPADDASSAEPTGELDLSALFTEDQNSCTSSASWGRQVHVRGNYAYVPRSRYQYKDSSGSERMAIHIVDLSDKSAPHIVGSVDVDPAVSNYNNGTGVYESVSLGSILLTDSALLVGRSTYVWNADDNTSTQRYEYDVFSLQNPKQPRFVSRFEVPPSVANHGWGRGPMGCGLDMGWGWWFPGSGTGAIVSGDIVASAHSVPLDDGTGRVRYYLDRLDVSDPAKPRLLPGINIPGEPVSFDAARGLVLTVDEAMVSHSVSDWEACRRLGVRSWLDDKNRCRVFHRSIHSLVLEGDKARRVGMVPLDETHGVSQIAVSASHVFFTLTKKTTDDVPMNPEAGKALALGTLLVDSDGRLRPLPEVDLGAGYAYSFSYVVARGSRAFISGPGELKIIDASTPDSPKLSTRTLPGYQCNSLQVSASRAYCAMGEYGVATFELE